LSVNLDDIYNDALRLPDESKAQLAERLIEYLATHIDPDLEQVHLDTVKRRKEEMKTDQVEPVNGKEGLAQARRILDQ
jgi:hypothetical protein